MALIGVATALALPFLPVEAEHTVVSWPVADQPAVSTTALFVPYRPATLTAVIPCTTLRSPEPRTVLATAAGADGLTVTSGAADATVSVNGRPRTIRPPDGDGDCRVTVAADAGGVSISGAAGGGVSLPGEPVPKVFGFRTELNPAASAGLSVTAEATSPFATNPTAIKRLAVAVQLAAAVLALALLRRGPPRRLRLPRPRAVWWVDAAVIAVLGAWAVIGPLAVDDGWATTIARNVIATGDAGNYYRWWNAPEVPFALSQEVLSRFTEISLAPLWLRLPSTVLAVATWLVLSRGVLGAALPRQAHSLGIRALAAVFLLTAWLPFNLGTRPESYVALGVTTVLALVWRARSPATLGWAALAAALTVPISPTGAMVVAPLVVFGPRIVWVLRARDGWRAVAQAMLLVCIGAVALTVMFADQTWAALLTATDWHTFFGPTLPWYHEPDRYAYLLSGDQQGSAPKRLPILLAAATAVLLIIVRSGRRTYPERSALRLGAVLTAALLMLAVVPSKWSYHLGATAGLLAAFLTVGIVVGWRRTRSSPAWVPVAGAVLLAGAAGLAFNGPNAWWLSTVYDLPWPTGHIRPLGVPMDNPLVWLVLAALGAAVCRRVRPDRVRRAVDAAPAVVTLTAAVAGVALLLGSFLSAPVRRTPGALAVSNVQRVTGSHLCGLADDIQVLPDGPPLAAAGGDGGQADGFRAQGGFHPAAPPPEPPGTGASTALWGSYGAPERATVTTPWFALPPLAPNGGVAVSVSGRTTDGNSLEFEFGRADGAEVTVLGAATPPDRVAIDEEPSHPLWRSIGVDAARVPAGTDRVRIRGADGTGGDELWLAFTGPRLRSVIGLTEFLAANGPVLISWPQAFVFPCVHNIATVSGGLAQTPRTVIESPRPFFGEDRDQNLGGTFAGLRMFDDLQELPTRLAGHPEVDWGTVRTSAPDVVRDAYTRSVTREVRWGADSTGHVSPEH